MQEHKDAKDDDTVDNKVRKSREGAEAVNQGLSDDLRFADAKAAFVALVVGAWLTAVNSIVGFSPTNSQHSVGVNRWLFCTFLSAAASLVACLVAIWPKIRRDGAYSIHHCVGMKSWSLKIKKGLKIGKESPELHATLLELCDCFSHQRKSGIKYDRSLLLEIAYRGHRCVTKYNCVRVATLFLGASLACGVGAMVLDWISNHRL